MTTDTQTTETSQDTQTTEAQTSPRLTTAQEIEALRSVHQFLSNFDRVPGNLTSAWSQALDTVAVVANSLIQKANEAEPKTDV